MRTFVKTAAGYTLADVMSAAEYVAEVHGAVTIRSLYERATADKAANAEDRETSRKAYQRRTGLDPKLDRRNWEESPEYQGYAERRGERHHRYGGLIPRAGMDRTVGEFLESRDGGPGIRRDIFEAIVLFEGDPLLEEFLGLKEVLMLK
jgi:hypothetical protein